MRVGLNQSCLPGISTAEFVDIAANCGAEAVELRVLGAHESPLAMGIAARAGGLPVVSVGPLMDWALPDDPDPTDRLEALLETASAAACDVVICVGPISERPLPSTPDIIAMASAASRNVCPVAVEQARCRRTNILLGNGANVACRGTSEHLARLVQRARGSGARLAHAVQNCW